MKIFNAQAKTFEKMANRYEVSNVEMGESSIDDLEKVVGKSNEIKQQSIPKALFEGNKNIKALAENDVVISKVLKNVLDWLLLVTSASEIRRAEYEDLTNQMLKFEDDVTMQMEMQIKFKRAFEQIQKKQQEQNDLFKTLERTRRLLIVSMAISVIALVLAVVI